MTPGQRALVALVLLALWIFNLATSHQKGRSQ